MMQTAQLWATRATCPKKQVGICIATPAGRVVLTGYNGAPANMLHCTQVGCDLDTNGDCQRAIHAEANAIALAAKLGIALNGYIAYITDFPCHKCFQLLVSAGISQVYYLHDRKDDDIRQRVMALSAASFVDVIKYNQ
jgi:dCMP deaminase